MRFLGIIFLASMTVCAFSEICPTAEEIKPCTCFEEEDTGTIEVDCTNEKNELKLEDLAQPIQSLMGKRNVEFSIDSFDLSKVPLDFFDGIGIRILTIYNCELFSVIQDDQIVLIGLENTLEYLRISSSIKKNNDLSKLKFGHLTRLRQITLDLNSIKELTNSWFQNAALEMITLSGNDIEKLGDKSFASLSNLKVLTLDDNRFGPVKRTMFPSPADHLEELYLQKNGLTSLPEDIFSNMPSLKEVSLFRNQISRLEKNAWESTWQQLDHLDLDDNPLQCDSHMDWLFDLRVPNVLRGECVAPTEKVGKNLKDFIKEGGA